MIIFLENVYSTKVSRYLVFDTIRLMAIVAQVNEVAPGPRVNLYIIFKKKNIIFLPTDQDLKTNWVWEDKQLFRGGLIKFVISINYTFKAKWSKISHKIYLKILDDFLSYKLYFSIEKKSHHFSFEIWILSYSVYLNTELFFFRRSIYSKNGNDCPALVSLLYLAMILFILEQILI